jgi:hypothetical protein
MGLVRRHLGGRGGLRGRDAGGERELVGRLGVLLLVVLGVVTVLLVIFLPMLRVLVGVLLELSVIFMPMSQVGVVPGPMLLVLLGVLLLVRLELSAVFLLLAGSSLLFGAGPPLSIALSLLPDFLVRWVLLG